MLQSSYVTNQEEADWLTSVERGDANVFAHLIEKYQNAVYYLCYRMLGNARDAEDAAQETFLRAYKSIRRYDKQRRFSTWILSIATNYCIDQLRKRRLLILSLDAIPYLDVPHTGLTPESSLVMEEDQQQVRALLASLSPKDRATIIMRYWYDFSYDEIAETLSLTNSAVKSRLHRARRRLAQTWAEQAVPPVPAQRMSYEAPAF